MSNDATDPLARPPAAAGGSRFRVGEWTVDPAVDEISRDGSVNKLEPRKMLLLVTLARRAGEVVTPDQLLDTVWAGVVVTQSSVYQSVAQLRKILGDNRSTPDYIATVPRKGYRLIAAVESIPTIGRDVAPIPSRLPPSRVALPLADASGIGPGAVGAVGARGQPAARRRWLLGAGLGATAIATGAGVWWWRSGPAIDGAVRIAVLPFADRSDGSIEQAAADGLANDVIHRFERSTNVLVLARNSTFTVRRMTDESAGLRALKQQLNADYALLGELFRSNDRIRVAVRLLAVASGKAVWTSVFTKPDDRLAEMPNLIASGALKALGLAEGPLSEMNPLDAYELYLLGLNAFQTQRSIEGIRKARDYFQHAIDTDPTYARAYAGVATTWLSQANYGFGVDMREAGARAPPLVDKALTLCDQAFEQVRVQGERLVDQRLRARRPRACRRRSRSSPATAR